MSLADLRARLNELGGYRTHPVVPLELFFEQNRQPASIGCNLSPHPGVDTFYRVLRDIRARPDVSDVVVQIVDDEGGELFPFSDRLYVVTSATEEEVHRWAALLSPDPPSPNANQGWLGDAAPPPGAPAVPNGCRVVCLFWD